MLEGGLGLLWVCGEVSGMVLARSGHRYFTLKDEFTQIRCTLFRNRAAHLTFEPTNGMELEAWVKPTLYEPRGEFQLTALELRRAGTGELQRRFEQLKAKLEAEGLFAAERRRPLPPFPHRVGIITSADGAAVRDIIAVMRERFAAIELILYPTRVQGDGAQEAILAAIATANRRQECDLLIIGRGGGSAEDLALFNDEAVVRAIANSNLVTVSAVGHEIDTTLADWVADLRAATPSAAAEQISPDGNELKQRLIGLTQQLLRTVQQQQQQRQQRWHYLQQPFTRPPPQLQQTMQRLDQLEWRLQQPLGQQLATARWRLEQALTALQRHSPLQRLFQQQQRLDRTHYRLRQLIEQRLAQQQQQLARQPQRLGHQLERRLQQSRHHFQTLLAQLHSVSPLATLERGYSTTHRQRDGTLLRHTEQLTTGELIVTQLQQGRILSQIIELNPETV